MNINRENYEEFFLDYHEGAISEEAKLQLIAFLELNPDLKEEFYAFENISFAEDTPAITFDFKESLKKQNTATLITKNNYHEFFIAAAEGDLLPSQQKQLEIFLSDNTSLFNEYQLYKKLKLVPDHSIVYDRKASLKHLSVFSLPISRKVLYQTASIAASLLLLASVSVYYYQHGNKIDSGMAVVSSHLYSNDTFKPIEKITEKVLPVEAKKQTQNKITETTVAVTVEVNKTEKSPVAQHRESTMSLLASRDINQLAVANRQNQLQSYDENRSYYTSVLDLLAFTDEKIANEDLIVSNDNYKNSILNSDLVKNQPIAEAGSFIKNAAIISFSRLEAIGADIKDTYQAIEKKLERK